MWKWIVAIIETIFTKSTGSARDDFKSVNTASLQIIDKLSNRIEVVETLEKECREERKIMSNKLNALEMRLNKLEK